VIGATGADVSGGLARAHNARVHFRMIQLAWRSAGKGQRLAMIAARRRNDSLNLRPFALEPVAARTLKAAIGVWFSCFTTTSVCAFSNARLLWRRRNAGARQRDYVLKLGELNRHANPVRRMLSARNRSRARWS
jgi:hypothetical protein